MVICIVALAVFSVLGIFSARYRALAGEAFECVFRMATLRPCSTNLNQRIRAKVVAKIFIRSPKAAGFVKRYFEPLSWAFTVLMVGSAALSVQAGYNLYKYGTCTPSDPGQCVLVQGHGEAGGSGNGGSGNGNCTPQPTPRPELRACAGKNCTACTDGTCS